MAKLLFAACLLLCLHILVVCAKPPEPGEQKQHGVRDGNLSEEEHYHEGGEHNADYDHETFLGKEKKSFDQLTPEESKERLGKIVDKIDKDSDGKVTAQELADWIKFTRKQNLYETVDKHWNDYKRREELHLNRNQRSTKRKVDPNAPIYWEKYKIINYGASPETSNIYRKQVADDERRWKHADLDKDGKLSKDEYGAVVQPWDYEHMRDNIAMETLEEIDTDNDGSVSVDEYLAQLFPNRGKEMSSDELKLYENEGEHFKTRRDVNQDGKMDEEEIKEWLFPASYDYALADANHLISQSDVDKDKQLTKEEILDKYTVFVGSRATNYGKDLTRHDEF